MVDVVNKRCEFEGCDALCPAFNVIGGKGRFCGKHKAPGMVNVKNKRCEHKECMHQPSFDVPDGKGRFCFDHKEPNMINVKNKYCIFEGCMVQATFDIMGGKGRYCCKHKEIGMIDVKHEMCEHEGCERRPSYDILGGKGRFCTKHKTNGMIDVVNRRCEHKGCCITSPVYNFEGGHGRFCNQHKEQGMINVNSKQCEHEGCKCHPSFNIKGGSGRFCSKHKDSDMINVKSNYCEREGCCVKHPSFDIEGGKGRLCVNHKEPGMVNVVSKRCAHKDCKCRPSFDYANGKGTFCLKHRMSGMINVKDKRCLKCPIIASIAKYKGYCYKCFMQTFPDDTIVRNHKTKEHAVADFIRENYVGLNITYDRCIAGGFSTSRPDIFIDLVSHVVVIEVDENKHKSYDIDRENKRSMMLFEDASKRPMVIIRFNPDKYKSNNKSTITSCWAHTKEKGICMVHESKKSEWNGRLSVLKTFIDQSLTLNQYTGLTIVQLFYDGWNNENYITIPSSFPALTASKPASSTAAPHSE